MNFESLVFNLHRSDISVEADVSIEAGDAAHVTSLTTEKNVTNASIHDLRHLVFRVLL